MDSVTPSPQHELPHVGKEQIDAFWAEHGHAFTDSLTEEEWKTFASEEPELARAIIDETNSERFESFALKAAFIAGSVATYALLRRQSIADRMGRLWGLKKGKNDP